MDPVEQLKFNSVKYTNPEMTELVIMAKNDKAINKESEQNMSVNVATDSEKDEVNEDFVRTVCCNASEIDNDTVGFTTNDGN